MALTSRGKLLVSPLQDLNAASLGMNSVIRGDAYLDGETNNVGIVRNYVFGTDQSGVFSITASATTNFTSPPPASDGALSSSGVATATFVGSAEVPAVLASSGITTATFTGLASTEASAEFASSAVAAVTFVGFTLDASGITRVYLDCCGDKENDVFVIK